MQNTIMMTDIRPTYIVFFQSVIVIPFTALFEVQFFIVGYNYRNGIYFYHQS